MKMEFNEHPTQEEIRFLDDRINEYNVARTGIGDGKEIALWVRDASGQIQAGLYGWTWGGCLEIAYLWVSEALRGQGCGSNLLRTAEQVAVERGCRVAVLDTHSFQAPDFYRQRGYEIVGAVDDYPRGHQKLYLRKMLS